jgi:hypothetical protein
MAHFKNCLATVPSGPSTPFIYVTRSRRGFPRGLWSGGWLLAWLRWSTRRRRFRFLRLLRHLGVGWPLWLSGFGYSGLSLDLRPRLDVVRSSHREPPAAPATSHELGGTRHDREPAAGETDVYPHSESGPDAADVEEGVQRVLYLTYVPSQFACHEIEICLPRVRKRQYGRDRCYGTCKQQGQHPHVRYSWSQKDERPREKDNDPGHESDEASSCLYPRRRAGDDLVTDIDSARVQPGQKAPGQHHEATHGSSHARQR